MPNFHSDEWVYEQLNRHKQFALSLYSEDRIVGIFCQGSTNYGLDTKDSDFDSKCIVVPTFKDIALARKPVSTTHILPNDEHCDGKDVRLYMETFRKQNLNFLEILFTDYCWINPLYEKQWARLVEKRESIARMNEFRAVKSMKGIAMEKYHAMEHPYPSKVEILAKYSYDPKQLHHLLRIEEYIGRYIDGVDYANCLKPLHPSYLVTVKNGGYDLETARVIAISAKENVERIADRFCSWHEDKEDKACRDLLEDVCYEIMKIAVKEEIK